MTVKQDARIGLAFAACHELIVGSEVSYLLGDDIERTRSALAGLVSDGSLRRLRFSARWAGYAVTRRGLQRLGSELPVPAPACEGLGRLVALAHFSARLRAARSDGVVVLSEREMLYRDSRRDEGSGGGNRFGVRVGGSRPANPAGLTYPDLAEVRSKGWRAVFVWTSAPPAPSLRSLLRAYGAQERATSLQFLVSERWIGELIRAAARSTGTADIVDVLNRD